MTTQARLVQVNEGSAIPETIRLMGTAITSAASYLPLLIHARNLASQAQPHDYFGQLEAIYNDVVTNWRYVRDPANMEAITVSAPEIMRFTLGFQPDGSRTLGTGDCDDVTIALGALLNAVGFNTRIVTSSDPAMPNIWTHVFIQAEIPGYGFVTVDPVLYPELPFASTVETTRLGYWDLNGNHKHTEKLSGVTCSLAGQVKSHFLDSMCVQNEPLVPFESIHNLGPQFGCELRNMGYFGNTDIPIELMPEDYIAPGKAIQPIIAVSPEDFEYLSVVGFPYPGMKAIGNTGYIYEYTKNAENLGYKPGDIFRAIGRGVTAIIDAAKNVVSWAWDKVENVFEATKVGRFILNVKDRVLDFAVQIVTPLAEFVGKWAPAAASIAAVIPGVGTLVSMGILATGAAAKAYVKYGVPIVNTIIEIDGQEYEVPVPEFENEEQEAAVLAELEFDINALSELPEDELHAYIEDWASNTDVPSSGNYFEADAAMLAELENEERLNQIAIERQAYENAYSSAQAVYEQQSIAAQQAAAAQQYYLYERPEVIQAMETQQAQAAANQAQVIQASQAAAAMAEAARNSAQRAIEAQFEQIALNDPQYQAEKLAQVSLELESLGYEIELK